MSSTTFEELLARTLITRQDTNMPQDVSAGERTLHFLATGMYSTCKET